MSKYSDPITAIGSLITLDAPYGGIFDSLSVPITPTQDLHGYSSPWPAGGGKNLLPLIDGTYAIGSTGASVKVENGVCTVTGTTRSSGGRTSRISEYFTLNAGTYIISPLVNDSPYVRIYLNKKSGNTVVSYSSGRSFTLSEDTEVYCGLGVESGKTYNRTFSPQVESGSTITSYSPYSNICPISGRTGLSVYVGPTQDQQDATTYAVDWTDEAGTVYGGTDEVVGGVLTDEWAEIPSYNGETITEPWLSSMDAYTPGATPTTGAQVVYKLATPLTYQLTPTQISMLVGGQNNVWVDTSAVITLIYRLLQVDRQTDRTSIGKRAESLDVLGKFSSISKVEVNVTENLFYEAGDSSGRTLTVDCPFGTQAMANNLLAMLQGYVYQPFEARRSIANPATELGDGVTVGDVYGGIYAIYHKCGPLHLADLSAPADEEIDHEYKFTPAFERKVERRLNNMQSELSVQADEIAAKVSKTGGSAQSFAWQLLATGFLLKSGNKTVFQADPSGITVTGQVNATSGYIGNGSAGFLISSRSISNGKSSLSDGNYGVYIGTDGIALGPNFKVDSSGNLTANSGTFTGYVRANKVQSGGDAGYITGSQIGGRTISVGNCSYGINTSLGNADYSADVFSGAVVARYTKANVMMTTTFTFNQRAMKLNTRTVKDGSGNNVTIQYLGAY